MGEGKRLKVVLDTNVLVSTLLFGGHLDFIREAWQQEKIVPIFCKDTLEELIKVLHYPKFGLLEEEIIHLVEFELLPYSEMIKKSIKLDSSLLKDKDDLKFLECALSGKVDFLVSGDKELLELREFNGIKIISAKELSEKINP